MSGKTLSNGTLSLRFMQNAQRAKQQQHVELEKAAVKDEAEWEISREIRDAWGAGPSQDVFCDTSYIPFMFPPSSETTSNPRGRRTFNKNGEEVLSQSVEPPVIEQPVEAEPAKRFIRPTNISSRNQSKKSAASPPSSSFKSARDVIFDNSSVGTDLRARPMPQNPPQPPMFLKPVGVDEPTHQTRDATTEQSEAVEIADDKKKKVKRERNDSEVGTEKPKKKKKKKQAAEE